MAEYSKCRSSICFHFSCLSALCLRGATETLVVFPVIFTCLDLHIHMISVILIISIFTGIGRRTPVLLQHTLADQAVLCSCVLISGKGFLAPEHLPGMTNVRELLASENQGFRQGRDPSYDPNALDKNNNFSLRCLCRLSHTRYSLWLLVGQDRL